MENKQLEPGYIATFDMKKHLTFQRNLGSGGTGDTMLFKDETTDSFFAIKKYVPKQTEYAKEDYVRFVEEIKIIFKLAHPNIVRVFNYYLYPELTTGYIQMEYIQGTTLDKFVPTADRGWDEIFIDAIGAFRYLESHKVLHRDIRPANFMITAEGSELKVIDFGFGKVISPENKSENSVLLNWTAKLPEEISNGGPYDERTEIYFLGCMFGKLTESDPFFSYSSILNKMSSYETKERYQSFGEVASDLNSTLFTQIKFKDDEKKVYRKFADCLLSLISYFAGDAVFEEDPQKIIGRLADVIKENSLEEVVEANPALIECFVKSRYSCDMDPKVPVTVVEDFYKMLVSQKAAKQNLIIQNIMNRLSTIRIETGDDPLPF